MLAYTRAIDLAIHFRKESLASEFVKEAEQWSINGVKVAGNSGNIVEVVCLSQHYRKVVKNMKRFAKKYNIKNANINGEVLAVDLSPMLQAIRKSR